MTVEPNNECMFYQQCVHLQKMTITNLLFIYMYRIVCLLLFFEDMLQYIISGPYS